MDSNIKILFVEDDEQIRSELLELLELDFENIFIASDGEEGLCVYEEKRPDIIISDIQMPKMDGLQMCAEIKNLNPDIKCILISAFNEKNYMQEAHKLDIIHYITKPIDIRELYECIEQCCKQIKETR